MIFPQLQTITYRYFLKPILFLFDPEYIHNLFTAIGESSERVSWLVKLLFRYSNPAQKKNVLGISFDNPIGLSAGFDYDGHMAQIMHSVGFGFNTVGTVTAMPYEGNQKPRLVRLPKSQSIMVNKGFKSGGAIEVRQRLDRKNLTHSTIGISIGSTNIHAINTINKAINDYLSTFKLFSNRKYVKYFELNISCPNIRLRGAFTQPNNFEKLCSTLSRLKLKQPIFVKMPNEISFIESDVLVTIALKHNIKGFIFSNLVKDRTNKYLDPIELSQVSHLPGNFSGKPTSENSNKLIAHTRKKFGNQIAIIGCGGVFSAMDAQAKLKAGADLVQLITGMIYVGPQLIGKINYDLTH